MTHKKDGQKEPSLNTEPFRIKNISIRNEGWVNYDYEPLPEQFGLSFERFAKSIEDATLPMVSMGIISQLNEQGHVIDWGDIVHYPLSSDDDIIDYMRSFSYTPEDYWIDPYIETLDERFEYQGWVWRQMWLGFSYPIRWGHRRFQGRLNSSQNRDNED